MLNEPNVVAPVLFVRFTPVLPELLAFVLPKFNEAFELLTVKPLPVGFVIVVVGLVKVPATLVRLIPVVALFVDEMLPKVAASVPLVRLSAWPVPLSVTSEIVRVPNPVPLMSVAAFPPVKPLSVLPVPTFIPVVALVMLTIVAFAP